MTTPPSATDVARVVLFARTLRAAGLPVSSRQVLELGRALGWIDTADPRQLYHAARALLVVRVEDFGLFDELFARFWGPAAPSRAPRKMPRAPRHDAAAALQFRLESFLARSARAADREVELSDRALTWSDAEVLQRKDFASMSEEELSAARRVVSQMRFAISERRTRRLVPARRGPVPDLRRTLRACVRHRGAVPVLPRRRHRVRARPLVVIADISGSMERYSRIFLLFLHSLARRLPDTETFVFGTRLTRITQRLRARDVDRALDEVCAEVVDWAGGTRIGESLGTFHRRWARRVLRRGAVVLVLSDGWERGDTGRLRRELRALRDRCHRLVWLNPRLGNPDYQPRVEGMSAALPLIDDFLPVHNLQSLAQLAEHLASIPRRRSARRTVRPAAVAAGSPERWEKEVP